MSAADNGLSDAEPARKRGGRGRQPRKIVVDAASTSSRGADSSVPGTPVQPTQTVNPNDPLAMDELSILGVTAAENTLPVLHKEGQTAGDANAVNRTMNAVAATSRPKRPKSIKFSPSKQKRRSAASKGQNGKETAAAEPDPAIPNHDYCDTCGGKGHFLCCDGGCLRSFHFVCLEPPVRLDEIADDEAWFCKACRASKDPPPKPPRGFFSELIYKAETENPTIFSLPADIKNWYRNVTAGPHGEYINSNEHRPPSKITGRPVGIEDRDGYRLKDKSGKTILCYRCNEAASVAKQRRIISCDFCDQHWHLDCLDPPMTALPPPTRKWMCPVHSDPNLVKRKVPRSTQTITVPRPGMPNNGDLIILPARKSIRPLDEFEEITVNRVRYQIPEETVILDFWARVHTGSKFKGLSSPERRQIFKQLSGANGHNRDISPNSLGSPLTSLDELSDGDAPGALAMPLPVITGPPLPPGAPSALDFLAQVAENAANSLALEQTTDEPKSASQAAAVSTAQAHPKNGLVIKLHDQRHRQQTSAPASPARPSKGESASAHNSTVTTNGAFGRRDQNAAWSRDGTGRQEDGHDVEDEDEVMGEHADGLDGQASFSPDAMSGATSEQDASMSYHQTGADTGADEEEDDDEDGDDYRAL